MVPGNTTAPRIFVNYRREDTLGTAGALASSLRASLEGGNVFFDGALESGQPWPDEIRNALQRSSVVLVLIGKRWLTAADDYGARRIDKEDDWVRVEILTALDAGKAVMPVLVDGALPPPAEAFHTAPRLAALSALQALAFSSLAWDDSFDRLCTQLERHGFRRALPRRADRLAAGPIRSTVPPRGSAPFHGRDDLLTEIQRVLDDTSPLVVLHGLPGVGKSELAREFARRNPSRFPGGRFVVDMRASGPPVDLVTLGWSVLHLELPRDMPLDAQCSVVLQSLAPQSLLIYDNAQSHEQVEMWLPPEGVLANVIVTSTRDGWHPRWREIPVSPLSDVDAMRLVAELAGPRLSADKATRIVLDAGGLPWALVPAAMSARKALVLRGSLDSSDPTTADTSFDLPWSVVDAEARVLLFACTFFHPDRISRGVLAEVFAETHRWRRYRTDSAIAVAKDQGLLQGDDPLHMHQLTSGFIRSRAIDLDAASVSAVVEHLAGLLIKTAQSVSDHPASADHTLDLLSFALDPEIWETAGMSAEWSHSVGYALSEVGRFLEAIPWLQRSATLALETGGRSCAQAGRSLHEAGLCFSRLGRHTEAQEWFERALDAIARCGPLAPSDHTYRARSMHLIGFCMSRRGLYEDARQWHERSVETARLAGPEHVDNETISGGLHQIGICLMKLGRPHSLAWFERARDACLLGDERGRVDYESLGRTLGYIAQCLSQDGKYAEAIDASKQAVDAKQRGDVHGRVDHLSVGVSVHQVGYWLSRLDRHEEALVWYERAAAISRQGDIYGRMDYAGVGLSLHQVANSLAALGRPAEARAMYESALSEKLRGDTFGRIDEASVAKTREKLAALSGG